MIWSLDSFGHRTRNKTSRLLWPQQSTSCEKFNQGLIFNLILFKLGVKEAAVSSVFQENCQKIPEKAKKQNKKEYFCVMIPLIYLGTPDQQVENCSSKGHGPGKHAVLIIASYCNSLVRADSDSGLSFSWLPIFNFVPPTPRKPRWIFVAHALVLLLHEHFCSAVSTHFLTAIEKRAWCHSFHILYCFIVSHCRWLPWTVLIAHCFFQS